MSKAEMPNWYVIDGFDGSGKSTLRQYIYDHLVSMGKDVVRTHEPGGTPFSEKIRDLMKFPKDHTGEGDLSNETRLAGMYCSRFNHYQKLIEPSLNEGKTVLCDRFDGSTYSYQAYGSEAAIAAFDALTALGKFKERFTIYLDVSYENSQARMDVRGEGRDEIEKQKGSAEAFNHARDGMYEYLGKYHPDSHLVVDTNGKTPEEVWEFVKAELFE